MTGVAVGGANVSRKVRGVSLSAIYFRLGWKDRAASLQGISVSGVNEIRGTQHGLTIGLYNYARTLNGVQLGLLNVAQNNPRWLQVLPFVNVNV